MGSVMRDTSTFGFGFSNRSSQKVLPGGGPCPQRKWTSGRKKCSAWPAAAPALLLQSPRSEREDRHRPAQGEARQDMERLQDLVRGTSGAGRTLLQVADQRLQGAHQ